MKVDQSAKPGEPPMKQTVVEVHPGETLRVILPSGRVITFAAFTSGKEMHKVDEEGKVGGLEGGWVREIALQGDDDTEHSMMDLCLGEHLWVLAPSMRQDELSNVKICKNCGVEKLDP